MKLEIIGTKFTILYGVEVGIKYVSQLFFPRQVGWVHSGSFMHWWDIIPTFLSLSFPRWPGVLELALHI